MSDQESFVQNLSETKEVQLAGPEAWEQYRTSRWKNDREQDNCFSTCESKE